MRKKRTVTTAFISILLVSFLAIVSIGLYMSSQRINELLISLGELTAMDIAMLVKNNFEITDAEVEYMKSLTFNEMEVDPINQRLMDVGNGVPLNAEVRNVYLLAPLSRDEIIYCADVNMADFLGIEQDRPLNGMWLLNGKINENGVFEIAQRDDIYRYTVLDHEQIKGMEQQEPFGTFSADAWGNFITGYVPIYSVEGNFVGLLGIDMDPDPYQRKIQNLIMFITVLVLLIVILMAVLFLTFYIKYVKAHEGQIQFEFYSKMSHEMRTPMNGILGMAAVSKQETNLSVLRHNIDLIEASGKEMMNLIDKMLDYQKVNQMTGHGAHDGTDAGREHEKNQRIENASANEKKEPGMFPGLKGKHLLLCEDQAINIVITRKLLEQVKCTLDVAENGECGLKLFEEAEPYVYDAILMDMRMPVMDGIEATKKIRGLQREDAKLIPIIALTANSYEEDKQATKEAGMNAHLTKPVEPTNLYATIETEIMKSQDRIKKQT